MSRRAKPNPPWVTRVLADNFEVMEERVPPKWLPLLTKTKAKGDRMVARMKEYGCGVYGCVLPTLDPRTVIKVTTDQTEAEFASEISSTLVVPVVVDYRMVMRMPAERKGSQIYLLWRESSENVGGLGDNELVSAQHEAAEAAYIEMYKTGTTTHAAIDAWKRSVIAMGAVTELAYLALGMLRVFEEQGVFFGDVHGGNVGRCLRGEKLEWVIIDPGHVSVVLP